MRRRFFLMGTGAVTMSSLLAPISSKALGNTPVGGDEIPTADGKSSDCADAHLVTMLVMIRGLQAAARRNDV